MTTMVTEVYDALLSAGCLTTRRAARPKRWPHTSRSSPGFGRTCALKWQVAGLYAIIAPVIWLLLRVAAKVGALPV